MTGKKVLIFAGTTEGRMLADRLADSGADVMARTSTEYGRSLIRKAKASSERLGDDGIIKLIRSGYGTVVDATHPYAVNITRKIKDACDSEGAEYIRLLRPEGADPDGCLTFPDIDSAVSFLNGTEGNILVTTGSKELEKYTRIDGYADRVTARVLSLPDVAAKCAELGFRGKNLICMQGPYSEELNLALLRQTGASYIVTKDSGPEGGFEEKLEAAGAAGAKVILIGRPPEEGESMDYGEVLELLEGRLGIGRIKRRITAVGMGMSHMQMTKEASEAVRTADVVIGAKRMLEIPEAAGKPKYREYEADKILDYLRSRTEYRNTVVLFSGDVGFFSGAKALHEKVDRDEFDIRMIPGISSPVHLCSRLGIPWNDIRMISAHGREANIVGHACRNGKVFALLEGKEGAERMLAQLTEYGMDHTEVAIGSNLGSADETVLRGHPSELTGHIPEGLSCALILNPSPEHHGTGIPDSEFVRGEAPMTKSEVRAIAMSKLRIQEDSVVYDIGAGTGSVSIECALAAPDGAVYAVERDDAAADLIEKNKKAFRTPNLEIIRGYAPDALDGLPAPTHAFIGGTSGRLREILTSIFERSPHARVCVTAITLETVSEMTECARSMDLEDDTVCINVSRSRLIGGYHMMTANNPIYISIMTRRRA